VIIAFIDLTSCDGMNFFRQFYTRRLEAKCVRLCTCECGVYERNNVRRH
jgi:hypothetical protein